MATSRLVETTLSGALAAAQILHPGQDQAPLHNPVAVSHQQIDQTLAPALHQEQEKSQFDFVKGPEITIPDAEILDATGSWNNDTIVVTTQDGRLITVDRFNPHSQQELLNLGDPLLLPHNRTSQDGSIIYATEAQIVESEGQQIRVVKGIHAINALSGERNYLPYSDASKINRICPLSDGRVAVLDIDVDEKTKGNATISIYDASMTELLATANYPFTTAATPSGVYRQSITELEGLIAFMRADSVHMLVPNPSSLDELSKVEAGYDVIGTPPSLNTPGSMINLIEHLGLLVKIEPIPRRMIDENFEFVKGDGVTIYNAIDLMRGNQPNIIGKGRFDYFFGSYTGQYQIMHIDLENGYAYLSGPVVLNAPLGENEEIKWGPGILRIATNGSIETLSVPSSDKSVADAPLWGQGGVLKLGGGRLTTLRPAHAKPTLYLPIASR